MKKDIMQKWVKALRSGDYKQGTRQLYKNNTYCCLGVLCEILKVPKEFSDDHRYGIGDDLSRVDLPLVARELSGMQSSVGSIEFPKGRALDLIMLNDNRKRSFKQIAAYIERNWKKL